jgi:hypothetical protein
MKRRLDIVPRPEASTWFASLGEMGYTTWGHPPALWDFRFQPLLLIRAEDSRQANIRLGIPKEVSLGSHYHFDWPGQAVD